MRALCPVCEGWWQLRAVPRLPRVPCHEGGVNRERERERKREREKERERETEEERQSERQGERETCALPPPRVSGNRGHLERF